MLEPRSNTLRRNVFEKELVESLALADQVVLARSLQAGEHSGGGAAASGDGGEAAARCGSSARSCTRMPMRLSMLLRRRLKAGRCGGDLSNGGFDGIYEKLPQRLRA